MNKTLKNVLSWILCVLTLLSTVSMIPVSAAGKPGQVSSGEVASVTATSQTLTWKKVSGAKGYYVYQKFSGGYKQIATVKSNTATVKNLTNGKLYSYKVKAYNNSGAGKSSKAFSGYTVGKTSKIKLSSVTTSVIALSWSAVSKATGYRVYMLKSGTYRKIASVKGKTSYKVRSLSPGTDYSFRIVAYKKGSSVTTFGANSAAKTFTTAPAQTKGLKAASGSGNITLSWSKDSKASGYQVYCYDRTKKAYVLLTSLQATSYKVTGLKSLTEYKFKVRSFRNKNNTVYGAFSSVVKCTTLPPQVVISGDSSSSDAISIVWKKVAGATGYEVFMLNSSGTKYERVQRSADNVYAEAGFSAGRKITLRVRCYVVTSNGTILYGEASPAYVVAVKPSAPANAKASGYSDDPIGVSWTAVEGATGYRVYKKLPSDDKWVSVGLSSSNSFVDKNVTEGLTYQYKVQAYIIGSGNVYYSNFSNVATVEYKASEERVRTIKDTGILGYLYNPDENYFYTANDPWQRRLGFTSLYDSFSPTTYMWYVTERIRFSYDNLDWMIQVWKGQYGYVFIGAEVGVYTKEKSREVLFYDCASDENRLKISFDYYTRANGLFPFTRRFTTTYDYYWWCTGFIPGMKYLDTDRSNMRLDIRITMKDTTMLNAFTYALENLERQSIYPFYQQKYKRGNVASQSTYTVNGLDVYFSY